MAKKIQKKFVQSIRYIEGMTIFFYDNESTYIDYGNYAVIVANRWFDRAPGSYRKRWSVFNQRLKTESIKTIYDILRLANHYEISIVCTTRGMPKVPSKIKTY